MVPRSWQRPGPMVLANDTARWKQAIPRPPVPRRGDEPAALLAGSCFLTAVRVMGSSFRGCRSPDRAQAGTEVAPERPVNHKPQSDREKPGPGPVRVGTHPGSAYRAGTGLPVSCWCRGCSSHDRAGHLATDRCGQVWVGAHQLAAGAGIASYLAAPTRSARPSCAACADQNERGSDTLVDAMAPGRITAEPDR